MNAQEFLAEMKAKVAAFFKSATADDIAAILPERHAQHKPAAVIRREQAERVRADSYARAVERSRIAG